MSTAKREKRTPAPAPEATVPSGVTDVPMAVEPVGEHAYPLAITDVPMPTADELAAPIHSQP